MTTTTTTRVQYDDNFTARSAQVRDALKLANTTRYKRAEIKRQLAARSTVESHGHAAELIEAPEDLLRGMRVAELLGACRRIGPKAVRGVLRAAGVGELMTLGRLTDRQRRALAAQLRTEG